MLAKYSPINPAVPKKSAGEPAPITNARNHMPTIRAINNRLEPRLRMRTYLILELE